MKALSISINPEHVENILNGIKRFELRKIGCMYPVQSLIICCTTLVEVVTGSQTLSV